MDTETQRRLYFDLEAVQSTMDIRTPDHLVLEYTRRMMGCLLFNAQPRRVLILGLGGGSLAKFCHKHLPEAIVTAVDISPDVIAYRDLFAIPPDSPRFRVQCIDGADYVRSAQSPKDIIFADACNRFGVAPTADTLEFYRSAYHCLRDGGVYVANLCGVRASWRHHVAKIHTVFGRDVIKLPAAFDNLIVFAFKGHMPASLDSNALKTTAADLKRRLHLNFPAYLRRLRLSQYWETCRPIGAPDR